MKICWPAGKNRRRSGHIRKAGMEVGDSGPKFPARKQLETSETADERRGYSLVCVVTCHIFGFSASSSPSGIRRSLHRGCLCEICYEGMKQARILLANQFIALPRSQEPEWLLSCFCALEGLAGSIPMQGETGVEDAGDGRLRSPVERHPRDERGWGEYG